MYEIYNDLRKLAEECMDVTESHFWENGDVDITGKRDGKEFHLSLKQVQE